MGHSGNDERVRAAIYCRISLSVMGDTTKVDDQEEQCREVARRLGWEVVEVLKDNSRSAWQRNRKRDGWDAMLKGLRDGRFTGLVSYWGDRIVRQPRDLEDLLDLRDGRKISVASVMGKYDFNNKDHRMMMRWEVGRACNESDTISERVSNHHEIRRGKGLVRPGGRGGRAFGFATDGVTHLEAECELIREMAARILRGEAASAIARDVSAHGWRTPAGNEFRHGTIRKMLARPRYAGLMPDGESAAAWEPVLDRQVWERVRVVMEAKAGAFDYATNARRWLLSGISACGACGAPMRIKPSKGRGRKEYTQGYGCSRTGCGKVYRSAPLLDAYVSARVVRLLNDPRQPEGTAPQAPDAAAMWAALTVERAETERLARDYADSAGRLALLMSRLDSIDARMAELRDREADDSRSRLLGTYRGITPTRFAALPLDVRRALVAASFRITVLPASGRGPGFRTEDVRLDPL
jgi:DNA invertase Pin-like site-specific DNA recombinase